MENTQPVFFYNFSDGTNTLKLNRDNYNEILSADLNEQQKKLFNNITNYEVKEFGNGVWQKGYDIELYTLVQYGDEYFVRSNKALSLDTLESAKDIVIQHQSKKPANENPTPKKKHTDTPILGSNGLEVVEDFSKPLPFYLYNKEEHRLMEINVINSEFNFNDVPSDLKGLLKSISPEELKKQQDQQNNSGRPFMNIGDNNQYFIIHPDYKKNNPDRISEKNFQEMMFLEKSGRTQFPKVTKPISSNKPLTNNNEKAYTI